ncbi:MAG: ribulose-phosphate 3-epimerase [Acidimicrobiales bacterium]
MHREIQIVPSVLPANLAALGEEVERLEEAGVDKIQFDVMDGHFVPNLTFGADVIASTRKYSSLPFEAHLMIQEPERTFEQYLAAGCDLIIVHAESTLHLDRTLTAIRAAGGRVGVALNPSTPEDALKYEYHLVDLILVMTVNPGFGGQQFLPEMKRKVASVATMRQSAAIDIEVDGGISAQTVSEIVAAGANHLVAGSALFRHPAGLKAAVSEMRSLAITAQGSS